MTQLEKEALKKAIKKIISKKLPKNYCMFYMTKKQMENNTATLCCEKLYDEEIKGNYYKFSPYCLEKQMQILNELEFKFKEILKDLPVTITTEIKKELGLEYAYIRLNY